ncbi:MAG: hypothetical protein KKF33_11805 [Alphaproteobacteria bacterium]|nr:hypothetical protein [Alphaproteobacteria bacterium]
MSLTTRKLTKQRDGLKTSAKVATDLANAERLLADQQHLAARKLENLADVLAEQVVAIETEIESAAAAEKK